MVDIHGDHACTDTLRPAARRDLIEMVQTVAPIVQPRQRVDHGETKPRVERVAHPVGAPLPRQLRPNPHRDLLDRERMIAHIGRAEVERRRGPLAVARRKKDDEGRMSRRATRAKLRHQSKPVVAGGEIGVDEEQVRRGLGREGQGGVAAENRDRFAEERPQLVSLLREPARLRPADQADTTLHRNRYRRRRRAIPRGEAGLPAALRHARRLMAHIGARHLEEGTAARLVVALLLPRPQERAHPR